MSVEWVRLGEVAQQSRDVVDVELGQTYKTLGLLNRGRGVFERAPISGTETKYTRFTRVRPGQLLYSKLFGWEGSVAVIPDGLEGFVVSPEFPVFDLGKEVHPAYVNHVVAWDGFVSQMASATTGLGQRRQRVNVSDFVNLQIPLPPLDEQRRISAYLDAVQGAAAQLSARAIPFPVSRLPRVIGDAIRDGDLPTTTVGELVTVCNTTIHPGDPLQGASDFVGLEHIDSHTGTRQGSRSIGDETGRKFLFRPGQVTFGYLRPYLNKAWVADRTGLCSVEQFVLEPVDGLDPELLAHLLRSAHVLDLAVAATNRLQLPRLSLKTLLAMDVPDVRRAPPGLTRRLDLLRDQFVELQEVSGRLATMRAGLLPAARNEIFNAMR